MGNEELGTARYILEQWARWLLCGGGYAERSSIARFREGFGGGDFSVSRLPLHVEPGMMVRTASRAMQHLRALDGNAAELLTMVYLEQAEIRALANQHAVTLGQIQERKRSAERSFFALYNELRPVAGEGRFETFETR